METGSQALSKGPHCQFVQIYDKLPECPCSCVPSVNTGPPCPFRNPAPSMPSPVQCILQADQSQNSGCCPLSSYAGGAGTNSLFSGQSQLCVFAENTIDFKNWPPYQCVCVPGTCPEISKNLIRSLGFDPMCSCECPKAVAKVAVSTSQSDGLATSEMSKSAKTVSKTNLKSTSSRTNSALKLAGSKNNIPPSDSVNSRLERTPKNLKESSSVVIAQTDKAMSGDAAGRSDSNGELIMHGKGFKIYDLNGEKVLFNYSKKNCKWLKCECSAKIQSCGCDEWKRITTYRNCCCPGARKQQQTKKKSVLKDLRPVHDVQNDFGDERKHVNRRILVEMVVCCKNQPISAEKGSDTPRRSSLIKNQSVQKKIDDVEPYYANEKFELYYPNKKTEVGVDFADAVSSACPITQDKLDYMMNMDFTSVLNKVDLNKNNVLRTIKRLDEKLNSPVCTFLKAYQPDVACACEETVKPDAQCPCPPEKEPLHFDLNEKNHPQSRTGLWNGWNCHTQQVSFIDTKHQQTTTLERYEIEKQVKALDDKLRSPEMYFLKPIEPEQLARCACQDTNYPQAHCACAPVRDPIDFRDKVDVQKKIKSIDAILKSPDIGITCGGRTKTNISSRSTLKSALKGSRDVSRLCLPGCPPPRCRCGKDCPAKPGPFEKFPERTFHVPDCPSDSGWMLQPRSPIQGTMACPFAPACCPIADTCPFPVATFPYDQNAPPLPPANGSRRCPLVATRMTSTATGDSSRPPCPLDPLKPPRSPPNCPLNSPSPCAMGQQSECPLLTCSLGPLKTLIFDGNEECPFCYAKCCPMISPDGPGCPISINSSFCPLGNTDVCCLKGLSSPPPQLASTGGPKNGEESCPIGELLEANAGTPGCRCSGQPSCPLSPPKPCPAVGSCYCRTPNAPNTPITSLRPESCPLGNIEVQVPPPPCPLSSSQMRQCPMTNLGDKNFDPSCPISNIFECPALRKKPYAWPASSANGENKIESKLELTNSERKDQPQDIKGIMHPTTSEKKTHVKSSPKKSKILKPKTSKDAQTNRRRSESIRKTDNEMTKTFSGIPKFIDHKKSVSSGSEIFEVSLESLPRPPLSETRLLRKSMNKHMSPEREDASLVTTSAPSDSKGFNRAEKKMKPRNCPIPDPEPCPMEVPKCPFGPPEPSCPLAKVPNCPVSVGKDGCMASMMMGTQKPECPAEMAPCSLFREGHCPMENLNMCECDFPIAPCLEPLIPIEDAQAEDQYCSRLDCCMGLPLPPTKPSEEFETDTWYAYVDEKPGHPATKHYLEILDVPPEPEFFVSVNEFRKHPAWKIIKYGEGYKKCKRIKDILTSRGPTNTVATQFVEDEIPDDEEIETIRRNQQEAAENMERVRLDNLTIKWQD